MADLDLSKLKKNTLDVSRGFTYTYYTSPASGSKPTLILFHGWPDSAAMWAGLINNFLLPNGYGVIALDCLGYGGTSKPTDPEAYAWSKMAADAAEILDAEKISKAISLGHDWGAGMAQRFYNFNPDRVIGLILINVAYIAPTGEFDLDTVNKMTEQAFGAGIYEYWHFFTADDATAIMDKVPETVYTVSHGDPETWKENWTRPGGMREYVTAGRTQPTLPYASGAHKEDFMKRFGEGSEGFAAPSCWYKAFRSGIQNEADKTLPEEHKRVNVPVFYWGAERDYVCRHQMFKATGPDLLPDTDSVVRDGGHWALLEQPQQFGEDILGWLQKRFN